MKNNDFITKSEFDSAFQLINDISNQIGGFKKIL